MRNYRLILSLLGLLSVGGSALLVLTRCGSTLSSSVNSYVATSNKGDLAVFSFSDRSLNISWTLTQAVTGIADKYYRSTALCSEADATYATRDCTVTTNVCISGDSTCATSEGPAVGSVFRVLESPGIGVMALPPDASQLFVGFVTGSCAATVSGTYLGVHLGLGQRNLFALYSPDSAFGSLTKADFLMNGTTNVATASINFDGSGTTPHALTFGSQTCAAGTRTLSVEGKTWSASLTANGMFLLDRPAGQGGTVAFDISNAATIDDLASKTLRGYVFPDDRAPVRFTLELGALNTSRVPVSRTSFDTTPALVFGDRLETFGSVSAIFNGSATPGTNGAAYSTNPFQSAYPTLATLPGLFHSPPGTSGSRHLIASGMKRNGKLLLFGVSFDDRTSTVSPAVAFPNTGTFVLFE